VPRIDVAAAFQAVNAGQAALIDVRSAEAWRSRHARGAVSLPLGDIEKLPSGALGTLPANKRPILYCT
jgi:rhodanese-related sulfurtransferase